MPSMIPIDTRHTERNTVQQIHNGIALYINEPKNKNALPIAVAPNHKPWQRPSMCFGATFDTNDKPSGEMNNSATVKKKYVTKNTHTPALDASCVSSDNARKSCADG